MNSHSVLNRTLLAVAGLVLLGGGLLVLTGALDLYRRWSLDPPTDWPLTGPHDVLLSTQDRTRWTDTDWWWPTVIAALTVVAALALWWLLAQLRHRHPGRLPVGNPPCDGVELHDSALADVLAADTARLPGVHKAHARLTGHTHRPQATLDLTLDPDANPRDVLHALESTLHRARQSTGWEQLPARATLRVASHRPHRAE
ncbi:alkaline shock response membrane anchor protein AmaP [Kitasatospora sp. NPDC085895]|uniref:alkaline shock response membrane anchor protein AmaP n=1 Tax=Kitasatospora sp. NPDC085895 TaxID=3155057 RepID=UPI00344EE0DD